MMTVRQKLAQLHDVAGGDFNRLAADDRLAAIRLVFGEDATPETLSRFVREYEALRRHGMALAEFVVTYGVLPPDVSPRDIEALNVAQPYAYALRVRLDAEAAAVAAGSVGSDAYYATFTGGDMKAARRLRAEALAARAIATR